MALLGQSVLPLLILASLASQACSRPYPVPIFCANNVAEAVQEAADTMYSIYQAVEDCTLPGQFDTTQGEAACTSDIVGIIENSASFGTVVMAATLNCEDYDNNCARDILGAIAVLSDGIGEIINAANDCIDDPFLCTLDIASAIDELNGFVITVIDAIRESCNAPFIRPVGKDRLIDFRNREKLRQELKDDLQKKLRSKGSGGYFDFEPGEINKKRKGQENIHWHYHEHGPSLHHRRLQDAITLANGSNLRSVLASFTEFRASLKHFHELASTHDFAELDGGVPAVWDEDQEEFGKIYE